MIRRLAVGLFVTLVGTFSAAEPAGAQFYNGIPWHGGYYHPAWGQPVALVVPPTARWQTHYQWGVPSTRITPIYHQFQPTFILPTEYPRFRHPLRWPSSTDQLGIYPVRGPW